MKITTCLTLTAGLSLLGASCAKQDSQASKPVKQAAQNTKPKTTTRKVAAQTSTQDIKTGESGQTNQTEAPKQSAQARQPQKDPATEPGAPAVSTNLFRTPADDIKLPTDAEIAEGKDTSGKQPADRPKSSPSISVKPPASSNP